MLGKNILATQYQNSRYLAAIEDPQAHLQGTHLVIREHSKIQDYQFPQELQYRFEVYPELSAQYWAFANHFPWV